MLRTLTLHLPTNLPPPLHAEVIWTFSTLRNELEPFESLQLFMSGRGYGGICWMPHKRSGVAIAHVQLHRFNKRPASRIRHSVGSNQEYQSLLGSAITLRLLALIARSPITISLRQSPQLDNGSDVVLLRSNGRKARS